MPTTPLVVSAAVATATDDDRLLDGSTEVLLAPVRGADLRRNLPRTLFRKRPARFLAKFAFAYALIAGGYTAFILGAPWPVQVLAGLVLGLMYAHLVELQHETLHEHAFNARPLNRIFGFLSGVFMLSSYSHYKYDHLRHHASLGTETNREFFNYRFRELDRPGGFVRALWHLGRYLDVFRDMARSLTKTPIPGVRPREHRRIQAEYRMFALMLAGAVVFTALTGNLIFVFAWLLPVIAVSEPTHFLIELPEHFGLNTQNDPDVLANTRTVRTGRLFAWFTNSNNLHTAHHYHQGVPMTNVPQLQSLIDERVRAEEQSYLTFFRKVVRGEIKYDDLGATCMTR